MNKAEADSLSSIKWNNFTFSQNQRSRNCSIVHLLFSKLNNLEIFGLLDQFYRDNFITSRQFCQKEMQQRNSHRTFTFTYQLPNKNEQISNTLVVSSDFDSGNLQNASFFRPYILTLQPSFDPFNSSCSFKPSNKTFFHFCIQTQQQCQLLVKIKKMKILQYFLTGSAFDRDKLFDDYYYMCILEGQKTLSGNIKNYKKIKPQKIRLVSNDQQNDIILQFRHKFSAQSVTYFAYHYPYPYQRIQEIMHNIKIYIDQNRPTQSNFEENNFLQNLYFKNQTLIDSIQGRSINLLTITFKNGMLQQQQPRISKSIFPYYDIEGRPNKFNKPYILLTSRVHPGETSASYALQGILQWIMCQNLLKDQNVSLNSNEKLYFHQYREEVEHLLKNFVFLIVPIINPDGVYHGCYRMDTLGHNLNRFYNNAQSHKQPSVFAIQTIISAYSSRLIFYADIHSHPHPGKGSFIYGNAFNTLHQQVQSQAYAKILHEHSQIFDYKASSFSLQQMNSKDINQILSKDGCGRVFCYKYTGLVHCYTMQMGYHGKGSKIFTIQDYKKHGVGMLRALLQIYKTTYEDLSKIKIVRQELAKEVYEKQERFKILDPSTGKKLKIIHQVIQQNIYQKICKNFPEMQINFRKTTACLISEEEGSIIRKNKDFIMRKDIYIRTKRQDIQVPQNFNYQKEQQESPSNKQTGFISCYEPGSVMLNQNSQSPETLSRIHFKNVSLPLRKKPQFLKSNRNQNSHSINSQKIRAAIATSVHPFPDSIFQQSQKDKKFNTLAQSYKKIKMMKLDFNPFPKFERRGLYDIVTNQTLKLQNDQTAKQIRDNKSLSRHKQIRNSNKIKGIDNSSMKRQKKQQKQQDLQSNPSNQQHQIKVQKNIEQPTLRKARTKSPEKISKPPVVFLLQPPSQKYKTLNIKNMNGVFPKLPSTIASNRMSPNIIRPQRTRGDGQKNRNFAVEIELHKKYQKQYGFKAQNQVRQSYTARR